MRQNSPKNLMYRGMRKNGVLPVWSTFNSTFKQVLGVQKIPEADWIFFIAIR